MKCSARPRWHVPFPHRCYTPARTLAPSFPPLVRTDPLSRQQTERLALAVHLRRSSPLGLPVPAWRNERSIPDLRFRTAMSHTRTTVAVPLSATHRSANSHSRTDLRLP